MWSTHKPRDNFVEPHSWRDYLVLPIIIRLIRKKSTLFEILYSQFLSSFSSLAVHAIWRFIDKYPEHVLLICDGYDEITEHDQIDSIINKSDHSDIKLILTTRPHGIPLLRSLGSCAVEKEAKILGFNNKQIQEYIRLFYEQINDPRKGQRLWKHLKIKNPNLLELSRIPIRLEMICIVWSVREDLGEHLVDLYIRFIQYLLDHLEKKRGHKRTPENLIMDEYKPLLLRIASLANSWNRSDRLETVMSYSDLKERLGEYLQDAIDLGCIVKYNPSSNLATSDWMFTHLSIQEYFVAFHLAKSDESTEITEYAKKCSTISRLQKQKLVLSFLCGMNPECANKLMQTAVKFISDKQESESLLSYLMDLIPFFRNVLQADLPLPHMVDVTKQDITNIRCLFNSDYKEHNRNLHTLVINDIKNPIYRKNLMYVKELIFTDNGKSPFVGHIKGIASSMTSLAAINVDSSHAKNSNIDYQQLFEWLPTDSMNKIEIKGHALLDQIGYRLERFENLQNLKISVQQMTNESEISNKIYRCAKSCKSLEEINLTTEGFPSVLMTLDDSVKINLTTLIQKQEEIDQFVKELQKKQTKPNIRTLKLLSKCPVTGCDYNNAISSFGSLLLCLPGIHALDLEDCEITEDTLYKVATGIIRNEGAKLDIKQLMLNSNNLKNGGVYLKQILNRTPSLDTLDLCYSDMTDYDFEKLAESNTCKRISKLRLTTSNINEEDSIRNITYNCHVLKVLCLHHDGINTHTLSCIDFSNLPQLRVLSLDGYDLSHSLCDVVNNIQSLEALGVAMCSMTNIQDLTQTIHSLPSLTHLDTRYNNYGSDVIEITKYKQQMSKLHRLNVGPMNNKRAKVVNDDEYEQYVSAIREELHQVNPDLLIYCDKDEIMWKMYK